MKQSKKTAVALSYCATVLNSLISIFITPFILACLGDSEYGVYRTVQALTSQLGLISLGLGTIASVFLAKYNARSDEKVKEERENFLAIGIIIGAIIAGLVFAVGMVLYLFVDELYASTMNVEQIKLVRDMFLLLVLNVAVYLFRDVFQGAVHGCERFVYANGLKVGRLLLRVLLLVALLKMGFGAMALVWCDLTLSVIVLLLDVYYCFGILKLRAKFHYWDNALFKALFTFSLAMFLQTIVNQVNQNLDGVILGATVAPERVAVYSLALTIYVAFCGLTNSVNGLFTPKAARMIQNQATQSELMEFVIRVGRMQCVVIMLLVGGFVVAGKEFVGIWVGRERMDVFYLTLILLLPAGLAVMLSGANSILDGYMKRLGRSVILIVAAAVNLVSSLILIQYFDYWGAAMGTALSVVIGQIFAMCLHYKNIFGFRPLRFYFKTFRGILPCVLLGIVLTIPLNLIACSDLWMFLIKGTAFVGIYGGGLLVFGLNSQEKKSLFGKFIKKYK